MSEQSPQIPSTPINNPGVTINAPTVEQAIAVRDTAIASAGPLVGPRLEGSYETPDGTTVRSTTEGGSKSTIESNASLTARDFHERKGLGLSGETHIAAPNRVSSIGNRVLSLFKK